jgi:Zn-dependent protease with chaperone function
MPIPPPCFPGGVLSDQLVGGRCGASLRFAPDRVIAELPATGDAAANREFSIRFSECLVELGGYNGRMLFCRTADGSLTLFSETAGFPRALAAAAGGLLDEQIQAATAKQRGARWRGRWVMLAATLLLTCFAVASVYGIRKAADASIRAVPLEVDRQIGQQAFRLMDRGGPEVHDPLLTAAVQEIVDRLAPHVEPDGLDFDVHIIDADICNAFCLPGGTIVLYTGLIRRAASPEEVAGVLAHEMAHAAERHGLRQVGQAIGLAAAINLLIGNVEGLVVAGAEVFKLATINSYSRVQEADADRAGVRMLAAAAIDPMSLARFFETMQREAGNLPAALTWLSTHPDHAARIADIRQQVGNLPRREYIPFQIDWEQVRQRCDSP